MDTMYDEELQAYPDLVFESGAQLPSRLRRNDDDERQHYI